MSMMFSTFKGGIDLDICKFYVLASFCPEEGRDCSRSFSFILGTSLTFSVFLSDYWLAFLVLGGI